MDIQTSIGREEEKNEGGTEAADVAIEADEVQVPFGGLHIARILHGAETDRGAEVNSRAQVQVKTKLKMQIEAEVYFLGIVAQLEDLLLPEGGIVVKVQLRVEADHWQSKQAVEGENLVSSPILY